MNFIQKIIKDKKVEVSKNREKNRINNSVLTTYKCPKCRANLFQINRKNGETRYFCRNCSYEGPRQ